MELKNWTHARQLLGYDRLGDPDCLVPLNEAHKAWCLMKNLYVPVMKLTGKVRVGRQDHPTRESKGGLLSKFNKYGNI